MSNINPDIENISWLVGKWIGKEGTVSCPTINPIKYDETLTISSAGQPNFHFDSVTYHSTNKNMMHRECGFIRINRERNTTALIIAQNSGITTVEEATISDKPNLVFESKNIGRMSFGKEPYVTKTKREFTLIDTNTLKQEFSMATSNTKEMKPHLKITYKREK